MKPHIKMLPDLVKSVQAIREIIISNIVLIGQIPAPTFSEKPRARFFLNRLADFGVDECTADSYGNAIGIIRGRDSSLPPIALTAHLDTFIDTDMVHGYMVNSNCIKGPGVSDNSTGVGVLLAVPEFLKRLGWRLRSDLVLIGAVESIGRGNLKGIRRLLNAWSRPLKSAVCIESVELGRVGYFSDGMIRGEIDCNIIVEKAWSHTYKHNAILVLNDVINQILELRLPQKPRTQVIIGKISGGFNHGEIAFDAKIGFEIRSDSDEIVKETYFDIRDIVLGVTKLYDVDLKLKRISNLNAARLLYCHPLVKTADSVLKALGIEPVSEPSESAQSIFISRGIPAITIAVTTGDNYHLESASIDIEPLYKGVAQLLSLIHAIDSGVCDEQ